MNCVPKGLDLGTDRNDLVNYATDVTPHSGPHGGHDLGP